MPIKNSIFIVEFIINGLKMEIQVKAPNLDMAYSTAVKKLDKALDGKLAYKITGCFDREVFENYVLFNT